MCGHASCRMFVDYILIILLLPSATTCMWGRCGRHNSPPASSVMGFIFRRSDGSHVSVDTVHSSLLRSSSLSSPGWCHLQSLSSGAFLVSPLDVSKPPQSCFPAPLCDVLYFKSLPSAHLHFCHFPVSSRGSYSHWYCRHPVQHSWLNITL